jgi:hypothetical protein
MSKLITIIAIIIVALLGFWYWNGNVKVAQNSPSPSPTATATPSGDTVSTPEITFSYGGDIALATKPDQILVKSYIPSCSEGFDYCLYYKGLTYENTNFESAGLRIDRRADLKTQSTCLNTMPEGYSDLRPVISNQTGYSTSVFGGLGDAGAGHYSSGDLYRLWFGTTCYEFETRIGETQFANYPAGSIVEFTDANRAAVQQKLKDLLANITITSTGVHPTWLTPEESRADYLRAQLAAAGVSGTQINSLLADKRLSLYPKQTVVYKPPDWQAVKNKLYSDTWVQKGADYIRANSLVFQQAETTYGVSKESLAGLIAMETDFGNNSGNYGVFNALYSRMLQWPESTWQAQAKQLAAFVKYCTSSNIDCFSIKGSYAGAFGIIQFMPDSLLAYGVDGNGDGVIRLSDPVDAVPSAARYLKEHGWASDPHTALARYYGSSEGYPDIVLTYASLLQQRGV